MPVQPSVGSGPAEAPLSGPQAKRSRRWAAWVLAVLVLVAAALGAAKAWLGAEPSAVTVDESVDRFRSSTTTPEGTVAPRSLQPIRAGVYVYATRGEESVDALGGDVHRYPTETGIIVTRTSCGYDLQWSPLDGRFDRFNLCVSRGGVLSQGDVAHHTFFRIAQEENFTCANPAWWLPPVGTTSWTTRCRSGFRVSNQVGKVVGTESMTVGGERRTAVHVRYDDTLSGGSTGSSTRDLWVDSESGLLLRMRHLSSTVNSTSIGKVTFHETIDLRLTSTEPRR